MVKIVLSFFDKLEDIVRIHLSHYPILYSFIGGVGVVLFWKGVWETAELIPELYGPSSIILGVLIMLLTGLMVSFFIGDSIILSGYKREKKLAEKTAQEVRAEKENLKYVVSRLESIEKKIDSFRKLKRTLQTKRKTNTRKHDQKT